MPPIRGVNWLIGLHVILAGLTAAWCAGRLGASKEGQFLSGLAYALGSAIISRIWAGHLAFIETNAWLPLAMGLSTQLHKRRGLVYLALVVAVIILAGQSEIYLFSLWWLPLFGTLAASRLRPGHAAPTILAIGLALALGLGIAAFQVLPFLELVSVSFRQTGVSWDFATGWSLPPWQLLQLLSPFVFGDPRAATGPTTRITGTNS